MADSGQIENAGRRDALKKIALGTAAMTSLPILGQAAATQGKSHYQRAAADGAADPSGRCKQ